MSPRAPRVTGSDLVRALRTAGFEIVRVRGSHHYLRRPGGSLVTVPVHPGETIGPKLLSYILDQAGMTPDQLQALL